MKKNKIETPSRPTRRRIRNDSRNARGGRKRRFIGNRRRSRSRTDGFSRLNLNGRLSLGSDGLKHASVTLDKTDTELAFKLQLGFQSVQNVIKRRHLFSPLFLICTLQAFFGLLNP